MRRIHILLVGVIAGLALGATVPTASAATVRITGGFSLLTVTADLASVGLGGQLFGTASADLSGTHPVVRFPMTGGSADTSTETGRAEHWGSGLTLRSLADPDVSGTMGNFVFDTASRSVTGGVIDRGTGDELMSNFHFFDLVSKGSPTRFQLRVSDSLAGALTSLFGVENLGGATFGTAVLSPVKSPTPVPLPPAVALLAAGIGALGLLRTRRRPVAA